MNPIVLIGSFLKKTIGFIGIVVTIVAGIIVAYQFFHKDLIEIEVKTIDKTQLTKTPDIEDLTVEYLYQDSVVENFWKIRCVISNIGSRTIIAKGDSKNIISEWLPIRFNENIKILSIVIDETNFPITIMDITDNTVNLEFKQWKQAEFADIIALVENFGETEPSLFIDERDIIDSKVIFTEFKPIQIKVDRKLIERLPLTFANILKWIFVISIIMFIVLILIAVVVGIKKEPKEKTKGIIPIVLFLEVYLLLPLIWIF
jgi:hypothetical protein